jgi:hypothetical protein
MAKVAALGCILCRVHFNAQDTPAEVHHIREGMGAMRRDDWLTIPLCPEHHRGQSGLHGLGEKGFYTRYKMDEYHLLALTLEAMA